MLAMETFGATYQELGRVLAEHGPRVAAALREAQHLKVGDTHDEALAYTRSLETLMVLMILENNRRVREDLVAAGALPAPPDHLGATQPQLQHLLAERGAAVVARTKAQLHPHEGNAHDEALVYTRALETLMAMLIVENNHQLEQDLRRLGALH